MIGIVDYGAGNLNSVKKAFDFLKRESKILKSAAEFTSINRLVLPGVGSFGHAMERIRATRLYGPIKAWIESGRPFLGICLGLHLLFESSEESERIEGLSVFKGTCRRFTEKKVPQIGWNNIRFEREINLLRGIRNGEFFYFIHSYYAVPEEREVAVAASHYGVNYTSIALRGNVLGIQFHPEKSGPAGLKLLQNWVERC
ncbi:MAG: imidazole glycerol phosphate synthase subunit HisH [Candidatus Aminicenantes bacterium]